MTRLLLIYYQSHKREVNHSWSNGHQGKQELLFLRPLSQPIPPLCFLRWKSLVKSQRSGFSGMSVDLCNEPVYEQQRNDSQEITEECFDSCSMAYISLKKIILLFFVGKNSMSRFYYASWQFLHKLISVEMVIYFNDR